MHIDTLHALELALLNAREFWRLGGVLTVYTCARENTNQMRSASPQDFMTFSHTAIQHSDLCLTQQLPPHSHNAPRDRLSTLTPEQVLASLPELADALHFYSLSQMRRVYLSMPHHCQAPAITARTMTREE